MVKEAKIVTATSKNYFNLVQMDKPVYKPGEKFRFRVLTLNHQTKPYNYNNLKVNIIDASGSIVRTFSEGRKSGFGFYDNSFVISDEPVLGNWKIEVEVDGGKAKTTKTFAVKDIKPSPFQVYLETAPKVSFDGYNPSINLKVFAKYPFDKFVKGTARITAKAFNKEISSSPLTEYKTQIPVNGGSESAKIDLKKDLSMHYVSKSINVEIKVEFIEEKLGRIVEQSQMVEVLPKGRHFIKLSKPETFKPGFSYKINAEVFTLDGNYEKSSSLPLSMKYKFNYKDNTLADGDVTHPQFLKDGKATFLINTTTEVQNFNLTFEFEKAKIEELIEAKKTNGDEILQVTFEPEK